MNCECIYWSKDTGKDKWYKNHLVSIAAEILDMGVELEPVALSVITEDVRCFKDYYDGGAVVTIPKGSTVLFVGGKYHYMDAIHSGRRVFHPYFPVDHEVHFEDINDCEAYNRAVAIRKAGSEA